MQQPSLKQNLNRSPEKKSAGQSGEAGTPQSFGATVSPCLRTISLLPFRDQESKKPERVKGEALLRQKDLLISMGLAPLSVHGLQRHVSRSQGKNKCPGPLLCALFSPAESQQFFTRTSPIVGCLARRLRSLTFLPRFQCRQTMRDKCPAPFDPAIGACFATG